MRDSANARHCSLPRRRGRCRDRGCEALGFRDWLKGHDPRPRRDRHEMHGLADFEPLGRSNHATFRDLSTQPGTRHPAAPISWKLNKVYRNESSLSRAAPSARQGYLAMRLCTVHESRGFADSRCCSMSSTLRKKAYRLRTASIHSSISMGEVRNPIASSWNSLRLRGRSISSGSNGALPNPLTLISRQTFRGLDVVQALRQRHAS